ncbi:hypothetical protein RIR_jg16543.t1 [Rhizophagus irregularis DAOM 181602=DAOM 197198]|nr:hypothetical protein RIR_jg16543.t1 [Rhizophagus irregularis DAOM 181602=DAOM 197198]
MHDLKFAFINEIFFVYFQKYAFLLSFILILYGILVRLFFFLFKVYLYYLFTILTILWDTLVYIFNIVTSKTPTYKKQE